MKSKFFEVVIHSNLLAGYYLIVKDDFSKVHKFYSVAEYVDFLDTQRGNIMTSWGVSMEVNNYLINKVLDDIKKFPDHFLLA
jgi:hypothetical protein